MQPGIPYSGTTEFTGLWQEIKKILEYLLSSRLQESLFPLKIIFIFISLIFFSAIIYFLVKTDFMQWWFLRTLKNFLFPKPLRREMITRKWKKIKKNLEKGEFESQWKVSLIESLNIFDENLEKIGYLGENLRERLDRLSKEEISNLDELFRAQEICHDVVRDPDYRLTKEEAKEVIEIFEEALKDLEVL